MLKVFARLFSVLALCLAGLFFLTELAGAFHYYLLTPPPRFDEPLGSALRDARDGGAPIDDLRGLARFEQRIGRSRLYEPSEAGAPNAGH